MIRIWTTKEFPFFADYGTGMHDFEVTEHDWQTLRQKALRLSEMIAMTKKEAFNMMHSYISQAEKQDSYYSGQQEKYLGIMQRITLALGLKWCTSDYDPEDYEIRIIETIAKLKEELTLAECAATVDFINIKNAYAQRHLKHPLEDPQNIYFESRHDPQNISFEAPRYSEYYNQAIYIRDLISQGLCVKDSHYVETKDDELSVVSDQLRKCLIKLVSIGIPKEQTLDMAIWATNNKFSPPKDAPRYSSGYGLSVVSDQFHEYFRLVSIGIPREQALDMAIEATNNNFSPREDTQPQ